MTTINEETIQIEIQMPIGGYNFAELRYELGRHLGESVPPSTLRRWIDSICLIGFKPLYDKDDVALLLSWALFKPRVRSVKLFQETVLKAIHEKRKHQNSSGIGSGNGNAYLEIPIVVQREENSAERPIYA